VIKGSEKSLEGESAHQIRVGRTKEKANMRRVDKQKQEKKKKEKTQTPNQKKKST